MMSFVNFETMRRRRVLWRRGGAPVGGAASGNELPDALRRSGTPFCSIGLARGPGSTWFLAETRARRAGKSPAPTCLVGTGAAAAGIVTWLPSLAIARGDQWALWAVISVAALVGIRSEDTAVGRALWGAVVSMLAASSLAVLGILPSEAHILNSARQSVSIH